MSKLGDEFVNHTSGEMVGKGRSLVTQLGDPKQVKRSHQTMSSKARAKRALKVIEETMQARRRRTQKQGPYKAGATLKAKAAADKIEAAMRKGRG